ncbi:MAG: hypothetical protein JSS02_09695 [Planctomycetes bacterium]|nr:hypothetical protein [Planctomycetota bacterium]
MFPDEEKYSSEVRKQFSKEFAFAREMLEFWLATKKDSWLDKNPLPTQTKRLAMGLHTQACRQMRTIIEECSRCESFGAEVTARCMFETILALVFILKPKVHVVTNPVVKDGQHLKTKDGVLRYSAKRPDTIDPESPYNELSHEFRTRLYLSHMLFQQVEHAEKCRRLGDSKQLGDMLANLINPDQVATATQWLGPIWTYILQERGQYSGLNVAELSLLLSPDLFRWYVTMYGPQSLFVHGLNAVVHVRTHADGSLGSAFQSDPDEVHRLLNVSAILFRLFMLEMEQDIGFGAAGQLANFQNEFDQIYLKD